MFDLKINSDACLCFILKFSLQGVLIYVANDFPISDTQVNCCYLIQREFCIAVHRFMERKTRFHASDWERLVSLGIQVLIAAGSSRFQ